MHEHILSYAALIHTAPRSDQKPHEQRGIRWWKSHKPRFSLLPNTHADRTMWVFGRTSAYGTHSDLGRMRTSS